MNIAVIALLAYGVLNALSCGRQQAATSQPIVLVSVVPQAYFVERIAQGNVKVEVVIPPGASHATYEPTMQQMMSMTKASAYVIVGHPQFSFETVWLNKLIAHNSHLKLIDGSQGISLLDDDPHTWVAPQTVRQMSKTITAVLSDILPEKKELFQRNLAEFEQEISKLETEIQSLLQDLPQRRFFVFHPAWGYFAKQFGLEQISIEHGHKEPGAEELSEVIAEARKEGAKVIFAQPQMSKVSAELVAKEIHGKVLIIDPLAKNWPESLLNAAKSLKEGLSL